MKKGQGCGNLWFLAVKMHDVSNCTTMNGPDSWRDARGKERPRQGLTVVEQFLSGYVYISWWKLKDWRKLGWYCSRRSEASSLCTQRSKYVYWKHHFKREVRIRPVLNRTHLWFSIPVENLTPLYLLHRPTTQWQFSDSDNDGKFYY